MLKLTLCRISILPSSETWGHAENKLVTPLESSSQHSQVDKVMEVNGEEVVDGDTDATARDKITKEKVREVKDAHGKSREPRSSLIFQATLFHFTSERQIC